MDLLVLLSVPPITTLFGSHTFETGLSIPQFGIAEFGINISSIAKRTRDTQHFFEREYFTQHFIKYAFLTFLKRCEEEGVCRSFVSKNFPYPYPNQYRQVNIFSTGQINKARYQIIKQKAASRPGVVFLWLMLWALWAVFRILVKYHNLGVALCT